MLDDRTLTKTETSRIIEKFSSYLAVYCDADESQWPHYIAASAQLLQIVNEYLTSDPED